jgi:hypothetical protein
VGYVVHQRGVERCGQADRLRKNSGVTLDQAVQSLGEEYDRDAQTCIFDKMSLDLIAARRSIDTVDIGGYLEAEEAVVVPRYIALEIARDHEQLPEFFVVRHSLKQVLYADLYRSGGITIDLRLSLARAARKQQDETR